MSAKACITCSICGGSYQSDCSCRYNRTPKNPSQQLQPQLKSLRDIVNDELNLWEEELKIKENQLTIKEQQLIIKEQQLIIKERELELKKT